MSFKTDCVSCGVSEITGAQADAMCYEQMITCPLCRGSAKLIDHRHRTYANGTEVRPTAIDVIEAALSKAVEADRLNAPFGLSSGEAAIWHRAQAEAFKFALGMIR